MREKDIIIICITVIACIIIITGTAILIMNTNHEKANTTVNITNNTNNTNHTINNTTTITNKTSTTNSTSSSNNQLVSGEHYASDGMIEGTYRGVDYALHGSYPYYSAQNGKTYYSAAQERSDMKKDIDSMKDEET